MSFAKKRRELNRAREEHEHSRVRAVLAQGRVALESIAESIIGQHVKELEEKLAAAQKDAELQRQRDELWAALENCRLLAAQQRKKVWAEFVLRFCSDAGVTGSPLRTAAARKEQK